MEVMYLMYNVVHMLCILLFNVMKMLYVNEK